MFQPWHRRPEEPACASVLLLQVSVRRPGLLVLLEHWTPDPAAQAGRARAASADPGLGPWGAARGGPGARPSWAQAAGIPSSSARPGCHCRSPRSTGPCLHHLLGRPTPACSQNCTKEKGVSFTHRESATFF